MHIYNTGVGGGRGGNFWKLVPPPLSGPFLKLPPSFPVPHTPL